MLSLDDFKHVFLYIVKMVVVGRGLGGGQKTSLFSGHWFLSDFFSFIIIRSPSMKFILCAIVVLKKEILI